MMLHWKTMPQRLLPVGANNRVLRMSKWTDGGLVKRCLSRRWRVSLRKHGMLDQWTVMCIWASLKFMVFHSLKDTLMSSSWVVHLHILVTLCANHCMLNFGINGWVGENSFPSLSIQLIKTNRFLFWGYGKDTEFSKVTFIQQIQVRMLDLQLQFPKVSWTTQGSIS
jgi:hypothetical protein